MSRYLHTLYCDDVREEVGNKHSFMGIYQSEMLVPELPFVVPKLCINLFLVSPADTPFTQVKLRILKDDEPLIEINIPESELNAVPPAEPVLEGAIAIQTLRFTAVLNAFVVDRPLILRARALTDTGEIKGPGLMFRLAAP